MKRFWNILKKIGRILLLIGKGVWKFVLRLLNRIVRLLFVLLITLFVYLIYGLTYEPGTKGKVTIRKIKRIRFLTKVKLYSWKYFSWFFIWIDNKYIESVYKKFSHQIEKK